jgi:bis(5'-nucleosyl)-tetraphosphatase (symmetrical)
MALYLIGDLQGCDAPLQRLLDTLAFSPSRDTLFLLGDLVNRGPASELVVRRLMGYGASAQCLLGNHDLHLLATAHGARKPSRKDTLAQVIDAPDRDALLHWLTHQKLAMQITVGRRDVLMVHAGVLPGWTATDTLQLAGEIERVLRSPEAGNFFSAMYGNAPNAWNPALQGTDRLRVVVNALTRLRFCTPQGAMEFEATGNAASAPAGYLPWFDVPGRKTADVAVAFGHWSTLGWLGRDDVFAMDSGCVWGGCLSALKVSPAKGGTGIDTERIQVPCEQAQKPGN